MEQLVDGMHLDYWWVRTNLSNTTSGTGRSSFLDPFYLFKGKLRAAATRSKFHDAADLRWLQGRYSDAIQARAVELDLQYIGLAMKRYPELELLFGRLGVDLAKQRMLHGIWTYLGSQRLLQGMFNEDY